jgi:hypothetical protein
LPTTTSTFTPSTSTAPKEFTSIPHVPNINIEPKPIISDPATVLAGTAIGNPNFTIPKYYNPNAINVSKLAEQQKKRKLLWSHKKEVDEDKWSNTTFSQDTDGKKANKFMRLMGIKDVKNEKVQKPEMPANVIETSTVKQSEDLFKKMEQQYEIARNITHLSKGVGFGFHDK